MTRYEQMAGTPEKFVEIIDKLCGYLEECSECPFKQAPCECGDKLLDWLNEPVEDSDEGA